MTVKLEMLPKSFARAAAVIVVAAGASACSSVPNWVDPTTWIGGDDNSATAAPDEQSAENSPTPDISSTPDKPAAPASTADEQKEVADSLNADRNQTQYSGDALRGGTEAAAPPPPDTPPPVQVADTSASSPANPATNPPSSGSDSLASAPSAETAAPATPTPAPTTSSGSPAVPASSAAAPQAAPTTRVAMAEQPSVATPAPGALPAVPPNAGSAVMLGAQPQQMSDAALGFQRSSAPPLDPAVGQFVPQSILDRYSETSAMSGGAGVQQPAVGTAVASTMKSGAAVRSGAKGGMGGPEQMSGAVVANFDSLQPAVTAQQNVYTDASGAAASAVVFFPRDTTILSAAAREQIRTAAQSYQSNGGQGYIRVVGHASSNSSSMSLERRMIWNFERSQARAKAVAAELIHDGVPADKVLVEAVGDSEPATFQAPDGQDGNRRADIFFQT